MGAEVPLLLKFTTEFLGRYIIEINESAAITVEQIEDEITVAIASVVGVDFQVTAAQALDLSRALAAAAANAVAEGVPTDEK